MLNTEPCINKTSYKYVGRNLRTARRLSHSKRLQSGHRICVCDGHGLTGTGVVVTQNRYHIEQARRDFHVGNLYFNCGCTAAIVGYQPFGGFKMSGADSKAGGPDYLTLHMQGKTSSEQL